jgi:1-acyl-sn-glycerol-3-phosphate acyltransferase
MRQLRACWRLLQVILHLLHGMAVLTWRFPGRDAAGRQARIQWWSGKLLRILGLTLESDGQPHAGAALIVANHISWLDIAAIHAVVPRARFVSKSDVMHWPMVGWLCKGVDTLFIERERKRDALRVVHQMAQALSEGDMVAVFPEGTTGSGRELLPFHANLLQAAIATRTPVQPIALRFSDTRHAVSPAVEFLGDTSLVQSIWRVACAEGLRVRVELCPPLASAHMERRALADRARETIEDRLAQLGWHNGSRE